MIEVKHFEFNVPHKCVFCKKKIATEKKTVRLAPSGVSNEYLSRIRSRDLGQWLHPEACFIKYFEAIDKERAVK